MKALSAEVVICGAGIAGISAAYHLAVRHGLRRIVLVDERPPLSLTSDKSTEAYRNWWPGPDEAMIGLMNRSIDLLEALAKESDNLFQLNRRGYVYATADPEHVPELCRLAETAREEGAGPIRYHEGLSTRSTYRPAPPTGYEGQPTGADLILDQVQIREYFPYHSKRTVALLHARRCGWFSGQQLGIYLLQRARAHGVRFMNAHVEGVVVAGGRVQKVELRQGNSAITVACSSFVNAAGPMLKEVGHMLGVELPVFSELHLKASFPDRLGVIPRDAPLLIWDDPQKLAWTREARDALAEWEETSWLLDEFPPGVHARPEGGRSSPNVLILWPYHPEPIEPVFPLPADPYFPELALRGMATMIPGLQAYLERLPRPYVDGGYYTRTEENRFLCGPLPVQGAYVIGALSGYGLMAACGAGELLAAHLTGSPLPSYAPTFQLDRYQDPTYQQLLRHWGPSMQI
ncbi:MAG: FAD-binding oxidoreductase [Chloroflexota bacterium]|nr:FAD-binding oxidoreductase [Chloroflexota bacterium]